MDVNRMGDLSMLDHHERREHEMEDNIAAMLGRAVSRSRLAALYPSKDTERRADAAVREMLEAIERLIARRDSLLTELKKAADWISETLAEQTFSYDEDWDRLAEIRKVIKEVESHGQEEKA